MPIVEPGSVFSQLEGYSIFIPYFEFQDVSKFTNITDIRFISVNNIEISSLSL